MTHLVFLDVETTGLDPNIHQVWEIAYALETGTIHASTVPHTSRGLSGQAAAVNGYFDRTTLLGELDEHQCGYRARFEREFQKTLVGATVVAANPAFDTAMLRARYGADLWHYRLIDIETYAMPWLGLERPPSLQTIVHELNEVGASIPEPTHTAKGDVAALRAAFKYLRDLYLHRITRP